MAYPKRVRLEAIRTLAFGGIGAAYAAIGVSTTQQVRVVKFDNATNVDIYFSIDGVLDQIWLPSGGFFLLDLTTNKVRDDGFFIDEGTFFYARAVGALPTSGSVRVTTVYAG